MSVRDLLLLNLTLQVFDGLFSYQIFSLGVAEANPLVAAAISEWSIVWGLLYNKLLACVLLIVIFAVSQKQRLLAKRALAFTALVYAIVAVASLWEILR
jgi:Domain of unknown function (DUF5658)